MDHSQAPVLEAIAAFHERGDVVFAPPGHKQGRGADPRLLDILGRGPFAADVLMMNGLDTRTQADSVLSRAQELMADAVNADRTFFSTCGSSLSVKSAMLAVAGPHEELLVSRNAHKSVVAGIIIAGIRPVWVEPDWDPRLQIAHPPTVAAVEAALDAHPDAKGLLYISPTDYGACGDIAEVTQACHRHGKPVIVDEAWGAHLPFHDGLPEWAMNVGADLCVTSVHKAGSGFEQSSIFQLRGDLVDPAVLKQREDLLGTTSSSALIYAALDGWRRQMVEHGYELIDAAVRRARWVRQALAELPGLHVVDEETLLARPGVHEVDPYHVLVDVAGLGISGYQASDWLYENEHVDVGLSDHRRVSALITHGDDAETTGRLVSALRALVEHHRETPVRRGVTSSPEDVLVPGAPDLDLETVMLPRDAFFGPTEDVPAERAVGRIAAELASPYPPGVPVLVPGDRITEKAVAYLRSGARAGMILPDPARPDLGTVRVVSEAVQEAVPEAAR